MLKTNEGRAEALATTEALFGDFRKLYEFPARYERVTAAQVKEAAAKVFADIARTTVVLVPDKSESGGEPAGSSGPGPAGYAGKPAPRKEVDR